MTAEKWAYVRDVHKGESVEICTVGAPLPEDLPGFGKRVGDCVRIKTSQGQFAPACIALDYLRENGWTVSPDVSEFTKEQIKYVVRKSIRERGWPLGLIDRVLPDPDKRVRNPHYRSAPPMSLYALCRVLLLEQREDVASAIAKTKEKRLGAKT